MSSPAPRHPSERAEKQKQDSFNSGGGTGGDPGGSLGGAPGRTFMVIDRREFKNMAVGTNDSKMHPSLLALTPLAGCCHAAAAEGGLGQLVSGAVISLEAEKQCGLTQQLPVINHPTERS